MGENRTVEAVIFDLDGLIVDSEELYMGSFNATLESHGGATLNVEDYGRQCTGKDVEINAEWAVTANKLTITPVDFLKQWMETHEAYLADPDKVTLRPGFLELYRHVRPKFKVAIASSTVRRRIVRTLTSGLLTRAPDLESLEAAFDSILSGTEVEHNKPAPDVYLKSAELLGVSPGRCVVFEDSSSGCRAAKAAGMTVYAVPNAFTMNHDHSMANGRLETLRDGIPLL